MIQDALNALMERKQERIERRVKTKARGVAIRGPLKVRARRNGGPPVAAQDAQEARIDPRSPRKPESSQGGPGGT